MEKALDKFRARDNGKYNVLLSKGVKAIIVMMLLATTQAQATIQDKQHYIGAEFGSSQLEPTLTDNNATTMDDRDFAWKILAGRYLTPKLVVEL